MDVGGWLRGLGLGQYETNFRDNKINADLLPRLTNDDLKDIGVSALGDRLQLLDAIAALAGAKPTADVPASQSAPTPRKGPAVSAERRPITVMFCDLVGSTSLAAKLDAEDWRNLVNAYLDQASAAVTDFGGHVLKKLGDGLMALFGYPPGAGERRRTCGARGARDPAGAWRTQCEKLREGRAGASRPIGLESGLVVVDASGEVFGEAPNVAARVQAAADPGSVLVTGSVQRQVAGLFVVEEKGAHELKGVAQPLSLYRVVRASGGGRRGGMRALTSFVGRDEELGLLARRWERARAGEGQLVLIVGEPGLGKSRLVEEFRARLTETPHTWVEWSASQLLQNTPLHPIAEWGRQRFGTDEPADRRLADLENTLRLIGLDASEYAPLLAPLVDIPLPEEHAAKFAPEELRRRQLAAVVAWFLAGARSQPVVLAFEDLHWADPTSLDLLRPLADRGAHAPLLLLATTRPEFRPPWSLRSHHSVISLSPLDRGGVARMVSEISARHALSNEQIEGVNERTGGVPLFVEEVTRLLLERGEQGGVQAIPPTLQQSLAARLDRLGPAREVAQIGAVLGRDFAYPLLRAVAEFDEAALQASLERLVDADLLFVEGAAPQATYRFKHALIQDAAYDSLLKSRRQALHLRAAELLRGQPERAAAEPEVIAQHFTQAGLDDLAIEWWGKAGDQALRRSAFQEAIAHLGKAIAMSDGAAGVSAQRPRLRAAYGNALFAARGPGAPETTEAFAKAREVAYGELEAPEQLAADYGLWVGSFVRGELAAMRVHAETFLGDAEARPDSPEAGVAHRTAGSTHWFAGEYRDARKHLEHALALFQPGRDDDLAFRFGQDPGVAAMLYLALTLWPLGDIGRAVSLVSDAEARIAGIAHVGTRAMGRMHAGLLELMRGDLSRAAQNAVELARLTRQHELPMWQAFGVFLEGAARPNSGEPFDGLDGMRRGVELLREQKVLFFDGLVRIALAEAEARAGDVERAITTIDEALETVDRTGCRVFEAELHRVRGEMLLKRDRANFPPAEEALHTAIAVAKQQGTRSFELRASLALAKLYQSTGRPADAHAVLAPALEGFTPTPEMPEVAQAQALLAALAKDERVGELLEKQQARAKIHVDYARAMQWAKGFGAEETRAALERAHEFVAPTPGHPDYWSLTYGRFAVSLLRGEFRAAQEIAETYLRQAEVERRPDHAVNARRLRGTVKLELGAFSESRRDFEELLENWDEERDKHLGVVTGADALCVGWAFMAQLMIILGDVEDGVHMSEDAIRRAESLGDFGSLAFATGQSLPVLAICGRIEAVLRRAEAFEANASEKGARLWESTARGWASWARGLIARDSAPAATEFRDIMAAKRERQGRHGQYMWQGLLAQLQGKAGAIDDALASIAEGLALAEQTGGHRADSFLHRVGGDILAARDPVAAEAAHREAVRIAREQGARTFELQAAHALAKLLIAGERRAEAHAILAPALEGFAPTPEMPEIAQAQALLAALAETTEVKGAEAQRQRRLHLQTAYGQAVMWSKGFAAEETKAALARIMEFAAKGDFAERFAAGRGQWVTAVTLGELRRARELASAFLKEAEDVGRVVEAGVARRGLAVACYRSGDFSEARTHCERALAACDPEREKETRERFTDDTGPVVMSVLAMTMWQLGEVERARELIDEVNQRARDLGHAPSMAHPLLWTSRLETLRGDAAAALSAAEALEALCREHGMPFWRVRAELNAGWARGRLHNAAAGAEDLRRALAAAADQGMMGDAWYYAALLAELEAQTLGADSALERIDEALTLARQVDNRCDLPFPHIMRGELLLKRDPSNPAPAEEAFRAALDVAKEQGARSWGLRAALSLAKLYQLTGRPAEAHAVLAPALAGFAPTPEMPEIAEAQALLERLA